MKKIYYVFFILISILIIKGDSLKYKSIKSNIKYTDNKEYKYIALTFDDGPSKYTNDIIDLLDKYDYNATFFMIGSNLNIDYKDTLEKLIKNGNEIGVHGYSHKSFTLLKDKDIEVEINKTKKYIYNLTEYMPILVRPPYGNINDKIKSLGYGPYILWNNDTLDWKYKNSKIIYNNFIKSIKNNDIVLMHDSYLTTYKALESIFKYLKDNNYKVVTVSKLASINDTVLESNKSYRYFKNS